MCGDGRGSRLSAQSPHLYPLLNTGNLHQGDRKELVHLGILSPQRFGFLTSREQTQYKDFGLWLPRVDKLYDGFNSICYSSAMFSCLFVPTQTTMTLGLIFFSSPSFSLHKVSLVVSPPVPKFRAWSGDKSSRHYFILVHQLHDGVPHKQYIRFIVFAVQDKPVMLRHPSVISLNTFCCMWNSCWVWVPLAHYTLRPQAAAASAGGASVPHSVPEPGASVSLLEPQHRQQPLLLLSWPWQQRQLFLDLFCKYAALNALSLLFF